MSLYPDHGGNNYITKGQRWKASLRANQIKIDFDLIDLFFNKEDQLLTVMIDEIVIESGQINNEIFLQGSVLEIKGNRELLEIILVMAALALCMLLAYIRN